MKFMRVQYTAIQGNLLNGSIRPLVQFLLDNAVEPNKRIAMNTDQINVED